MRVDLRTWLDQSVEGQAQWEPFAFELAFGLPAGPGRDARSVREEVTLDGGWRLRGIVDLVERRRGAPGLRVTDHKTGVNCTAAGLVVGKGEALQPVLYGLAVERIFGEQVVESRLSYCTRAGEFSERVVPMTPPNRRRGLEVVELIDRAIARGFLPPAPRQRACAMCDFTAVCGPGEERRIARKDARALEELTSSGAGREPAGRFRRARAHPDLARRDDGRRGRGGHGQDQRAGRAAGRRCSRRGGAACRPSSRSRSPRRRRAS